jgi:hypothetical protein
MGRKSHIAEKRIGNLPETVVFLPLDQIVLEACGKVEISV